MRADRRVIEERLERIMASYRKTGLRDHAIEKLQRLETSLDRAMNLKFQRRTSVPPLVYPQALPILSKKDEIIQAIRNHPVVIITGETGSGKTTQIPKMCIEAGRGIDGIIGCTQPRRIAATTVSQRISEELGQAIGKSVGYKIRFDDRSSRDNYIRIMTDGVLLMEAQADPFLNNYDTIIVDEAHERTVNIDFILGILKRLLVRRRDLKVVITSATIDVEKFSRSFDGAPLIEVSGRMYPVEVRYRPVDETPVTNDDPSYVDAAVNAVDALMKERREGGDILIFMPTEQDIRETCDMLSGRNYKNVVILPLYARLPAGEQRRVFAPAGGRKIIVATNVAETSVTIPGITYVIDTGLARISQYNPATRTSGLPIQAISKSSADQRKGRCGRVRNGICIRIFSEDDYESRPQFTIPEILRSNLAEVILRMMALRIGDIHTFPFIDAPHVKHIRDGFDILEELDAARKENSSEEHSGSYRLTVKGKTMARLPIDPRISRMILESQKEGCAGDVLVIASALSTQNPRERPVDREADADRIHKSFMNPSSDFITLLTIWERYHEAWNTWKTQGKMRKFCKSHFLSYKRMREWKDIHDQITMILNEENMDTQNRKNLPGEERYMGIHRSIVSGYLSNIAVREEKNIYKKAKGGNVMIFPGSGVFNSGGNWIVAAEIVETTRRFARTVANIDNTWVEEVGASLCRYTYSEPHWDARRGAVMAYEQVSLYGLVIVSQRRVLYGSINGADASDIFIRKALVEGEIGKPFSFISHNRQLIEKINSMEDKIRRRDILVDEETLVEFYRRHIPGVYDIRTLQKKIREQGGDSFLKMTVEDLLRYDPADELVKYPDELSLGTASLPLTYRFDIGTARDGVTVTVPATLTSSVPLDSMDWIVPGLLHEKIATLIKGLPKNYRKKLVPVAQTVNIIVHEIQPGKGSLLSTLSRFIYERFGVDIPAAAWPLDILPDYLKMRLAVVDHDGKELFSGRDIEELPPILPSAPSPAFRKARAAWEKSGLTRWSFGDLPDCLELKIFGSTSGEVAFPAIERGEGCINIRLFQNKADANETHRHGVIALFELYFRKDLQYLRKTLILKEPLKQWGAYFGGSKCLEENLYQRVLRDLFDIPLRTEKAFELHAGQIKPLILARGQELMAYIEPAVRSYHETRSTLHALLTAHRSNTVIKKFLTRLGKELEQLMPEDFPLRYDHDRLDHLPRYLKAVAIRAERGVLNLDKDQKRSTDLMECIRYLDDLHATTGPASSNEKQKALEEFRWMIEEYKVSLFAQELKTPFPVSRKRLEKRYKEIRRML
ncbi:MAG: ATP-dependent RNA helicase HrpA [Deltaproteobacteria bacterium]|nr:ATP-dependent RNA helicase HrpA [Deltaproteobacteria bacterium]